MVAPAASPTKTSLIQDAKTFQVVSFQLGKEEYGVDIMVVQEIILLGNITHVPEVPEYILGVINLRGNVIPILNLRKRFGLEEVDSTDETRIVVINYEGRTVGIVVDSVSEVLRLTNEQISPAPASLSGGERDYITSLARLGEKLLILLDVDRVLGATDSSAVDNTNTNSNQEPAACET